LHLPTGVLLDEMRFVKKVFKKNPSFKMLRFMIGSLLISTDLERKLIPIIEQYRKKGYTIHLYSYWNDLSAVALALLKRKYTSMNACSRAHAFEIYDERHHMNYIPFQQLKYKQLNHIFFISEFGLRYIQQRFNVLDFTRCSVSKLGCFEMPGPVYAKDPACIRILSIGYNYAIKRVDLIAKSLLKIKGLKIIWVHVGEAMKDKDHYHHLVNELLSPVTSINFQFPGNLKRDQLKQLYGQTTFDVLLNVSPLEGIPVSMMECMSAGIPVIATSVGGVPEIVKENYNGVLLSANPEPGEVAEALHKFHSQSEEELMIFRKNARITWEANHNALINYSRFAEELLGHKEVIA
jgi:glycosyltransferase involved in cell wall biosynthesis